MNVAEELLILRWHFFLAPPFQDVQVSSVLQMLAGKSYKWHQTF